MRSVCGGHGGRRRQAHEQEPVACGALGRRGVLSARQRLGTVCLPNAQGGSAGGQRLWRGGDACLPHEPGADRLRCVPFAAGAGADGGRLTSRSLPPAARWATLPCPGGARGAAGVRIRRCLPLRGKGAAEWRAGSWCVAGGSRVLERFAYHGGFSGAPGGRKHAALRSMRPPSPRNHPAGGTAGSARTRSRVQTLENPFLGERPRFSPLPRLPKRRRRQAPARGLAVVYAHDRPKRNEAQRIRPLLVGRMRVESEPTA